jgi:hypothetical protein
MSRRYFAGPWIASNHHLRHLDRINGNDRGLLARIATTLRTEASERAVCIAWGLAAPIIAYIAWGVCSVLFMGDYPL